MQEGVLRDTFRKWEERFVDGCADYCGGLDKKFHSSRSGKYSAIFRTQHAYTFDKCYRQGSAERLIWNDFIRGYFTGWVTRSWGWFSWKKHIGGSYILEPHYFGLALYEQCVAIFGPMRGNDLIDVERAMCNGYSRDSRLGFLGIWDIIVEFSAWWKIR